MRVLIVCSRNSGKIAPFILEQARALEREGVELDFFPIEGKGFWGYLKNRKSFVQKIDAFKPQLVHAHFGLSGLLANTQRHIPVVTSYHGSDINNNLIYPLSRFCMFLSAFNIFVTEKNRVKSRQKNKQTLIPCGVNTELFKPMEKDEARDSLGFDHNKKFVLFAGSFSTVVKNAGLAKSAVALLPEVQLIELSGLSRQEVALLINAVDVVLMTSFTEGSPQIIKEALACNCAVVSVPVGDVSEIIEDIAGCAICDYNPIDVAEKLQITLNVGKLSEGRTRIMKLGLDETKVAKRVVSIYKSLIH